MLAVFRFVFYKKCTWSFFCSTQHLAAAAWIQPAWSFPVVIPDLPQLNWKYCEIFSDLPGVCEKRALTPYNLSSFSLCETEKPKQKWNLGAAFSYTNNQRKTPSRIKALRKSTPTYFDLIWIAVGCQEFQEFSSVENQILYLVPGCDIVVVLKNMNATVVIYTHSLVELTV